VGIAGSPIHGLRWDHVPTPAQSVLTDLGTTLFSYPVPDF
jgi:hypothetical protein